MNIPQFAPRWTNADVDEICSVRLQKYLFKLIEDQLALQNKLDNWQHFSIEQSSIHGVYIASILHHQEKPAYRQMHLFGGYHLKVPKLDLWIIDYGDVSVLMKAS